MTRTLPRTLAGVVEELELEQPRVVTLESIGAIARRLQLRSEPKLVAARLRQHGWLLPTGVRGVWEFAPGSHAGPYGHGDPFTLVQAVLRRHPALPVAVAQGSAAWVHGYADRLPGRPELAVPRGVEVPAPLARLARVSHFDTALELVVAKGVPTHRVETVLVHLAERPSGVRSWSSVAEWLPALAADADVQLVTVELAGRARSTQVRLGYLVQALRPDLAEPLRAAVASKTWFGGRGPLRRHSQRWQVADTLLPFDPTTLVAEHRGEPAE